jgi:hypothetical protein
MICAPRAEASQIFSVARERFSSALVVQRICTSPTVNLLAMNFSLTSGASGGECAHWSPQIVSSRALLQKKYASILRNRDKNQLRIFSGRENAEAAEEDRHGARAA